MIFLVTQKSTILFLKSFSKIESNDYIFLIPFSASSTCPKLIMTTPRWAEMAIHNIASSGKFSSDRTISEYAT